MKIKKVFFICSVICLMFYSCGDDDTSSGNKLSPPSWIIGTWESSSQTNSYFKVQFTKDNLIYTMVVNGSEISRNLLEESKISYPIVTLNELVKTDSEYHVRITLDSGQAAGSNDYIFRKKSNSDIVYVLHDDELIDPVLTKK